MLNTCIEVVCESKLWISSSVGVPPVPDGRHGSLQALQRPARGFEPRQRDPEIRENMFSASQCYGSKIALGNNKEQMKDDKTNFWKQN